MNPSNIAHFIGDMDVEDDTYRRAYVEVNGTFYEIKSVRIREGHLTFKAEEASDEP